MFILLVKVLVVEYYAGFNYELWWLVNLHMRTSYKDYTMLSILWVPSAGFEPTASDLTSKVATLPLSYEGTVLLTDRM